MDRQAGVRGGDRPSGRQRLLVATVVAAVVGQLGAMATPASAQLAPQPRLDVLQRYTIEFENAGYSAGEGSAAAVVTVRRHDALRLGVGLPLLNRSTVRLRTSDGSAQAGYDYTPVDVEVEFKGRDTTQKVPIPLLNDGFREPDETINLTLGPEVKGARLGRRTTAVLSIRDDGQACSPLSAEERRRALDSWLSRLDPNADDDGDGFTNAQELGPLAFDPVADPTRFNPLIADVPRIHHDDKGDIALALLDSVTEGKQLGTLRISEDERKSLDVDRQTKTTVEAHQFGIDLKGGVDQGDKTGLVGLSYNYTRSTTNERTIEIGQEVRRLKRRELNEIISSETQVGGGTLAVTYALKNTGNVAFRIESANLVARERLPDGRFAAFGILKPDFEFGKGPTLGPGQEKNILFEMDGIGARDALDLANDLSALETEVGSLELSQIAVGAFQAGSGNFAQYQTTVRQNTAQVSIDYGDDVDDDGAPDESDAQFVSTTFLRDQAGRPLGIPLCDAVQILMGRELKLFDPPGGDFGGRQPVSIRSVGRRSPAQTLESHKDSNGYWITEVDAATVGGAEDYRPPDVHLRAAHAASLVYIKDQDRDLLDHRDETRERTSDDNRDSDGDGLTDFQEVADSRKCDRAPDPLRDLCGPFHVTLHDRVGEPVDSRQVVATDPVCVDPDRDGLTDKYEKQRSRDQDPERSLDPWQYDTDLDGVPDGGRIPSAGTKRCELSDTNGNGVADALDTDGNGVPDVGDPWTSPAGVAARIYRENPENPGVITDDADFILSRIDKNIDVDFDSGSPDIAVPTDGFLIRWTGSITVPQDGTYFFGGKKDKDDDGMKMRIFVNHEPITVFDHGQDTTADGYLFDRPVPLQKEQKVKFEVDYYERTGSARTHLGYLLEPDHPDLQDADNRTKVVPQAWLSPDPTVTIRRARGLTAQYYFDADKDGELDDNDDEQAILKRVEERVDRNWFGGSPDPSVVPWDYFIGRWTGLVRLPENLPAGDYQFGAVHDDSLRISVDGQELYNANTVRDAVEWGSAVSLTPGRPVPIEVLFREKDGPARVHVYVRPAGDTSQSQILPSEWLIPDPNITPSPGLPREEKWVYIGNTRPYGAWMEASGSGMNHCDTGPVGIGFDLRSYCPIPGHAFHIEIKLYRTVEPHPQIGETINLTRTPGNDICIWLTGDAANPGYERRDNSKCEELHPFLKEPERK